MRLAVLIPVVFLPGAAVCVAGLYYLLWKLDLLP